VSSGDVDRIPIAHVAGIRSFAARVNSCYFASVRPKIGIVALAFVIAASCQQSQTNAPPDEPPQEAQNADAIRQPSSAFFSTAMPGGIHQGRIYLAIPLLTDQSGTREQKRETREAFFKKAVPGMEKWSESAPVDSRKEGYGGDIIPDQYLDLKYVEASTPYKIGQSLKMRTTEGVVPIRIGKYEIHHSYASGDFFLYAIGEPANGVVSARASEQVLASAELPDCGKSCALARNKPAADKAQKVRAVAVEKLGVQFPSDLPNDERTETLLIYEGHFTRTDSIQYVAFFARHSKDAVDVGKWVTYVVDSDFSLMSVLGRDAYLQITPDGVADVNGDRLDEIWCNDVGFEGTAYSLWYLRSTASVSFGSVEWPYFGL
jgi:hypothetical protein